MNQEHHDHLNRILAEVTRDLRAKYENGQREHGGNLWLKPRMLENAIDEVLDLAVYLYTLKEQLSATTTPSKPEPSSQRAHDAVVAGT